MLGWLIPSVTGNGLFIAVNEDAIRAFVAAVEEELLLP